MTVIDVPPNWTFSSWVNRDQKIWVLVWQIIKYYHWKIRLWVELCSVIWFLANFNEGRISTWCFLTSFVALNMECLTCPQNFQRINPQHWVYYVNTMQSPCPDEGIMLTYTPESLIFVFEKPFLLSSQFHKPKPPRYCMTTCLWPILTFRLWRVGWKVILPLRYSTGRLEGGYSFASSPSLYCRG